MKQKIQQIKQKKQNNQKDALSKLKKASILCIVFIIIEITGGIISGSLSIYADALHMLSDFSGFAISMISIIISKRRSNSSFTYGYYRAEVLGALGSLVTIWVITAALVYEAILRFISNEYEIVGNVMLGVAIVGLLSNIWMGKILHSVMVDFLMCRVGIIIMDVVDMGIVIVMGIIMGMKMRRVIS